MNVATRPGREPNPEQPISPTHNPITTKRKPPKWSDVKTRLADLDRAGLVNLLKDLYAANKENRLFLHSRFALGDDELSPYKLTIKRWLWPDPFKNQDTSVAKAKKAIAAYKKAVGQALGLAELMVFFCEQAAGFADEIGLDDEAYYEALVLMFEHTLKTIATLPAEYQRDLWERLDEVRYLSEHCAYGVGEDLRDLLAEYEVID